jgi:hypothetical protein
MLARRVRGCGYWTHRRRRTRSNAPATTTTTTNARGFDGTKIPCVAPARFHRPVAFASMRNPASTSMTDRGASIDAQSLSRALCGWLKDVDVPMRPKPLMATLTLASVTTLTLACDKCMNVDASSVARTTIAARPNRSRVSRELPDRSRHPGCVRVHTLAAARGAVALRKLPASAVRAVSSTVYVSREMRR